MNKNLLDYFNGDEFCAGVWKSKYAMEGETTPDDMHKRLAKEFARIESKYQDEEKEIATLLDNLDKISEYGKNRAHLTEKDIYRLFKNFKYIIPQGRVMAGLGVKESYRSLSNCLRLPPPKDSYSSIMYTDTMLISSAKRGCGYGLGLSNLRPDTAFVSNAANSSTGAASFMERYSNSTREVAQKGRRGACLLDMEIFHPDVLQFITAKKDRTSVTGANISVKLYDEFMEAVENDDDFWLRFPCDLKYEDFTRENKIVGYNELVDCGDGKYIKRIKAKEYWNEIIDNAWDNAEPGLFFWDRVINYDPSSVYKKYFIDGTNACGEQPMAVFDTCRLILLNLYSFVKNPFTPEAEIDYEMLYKVSYEQLRLGDALVELEIEYIDRILAKIKSDSLPDKEKAIEFDLWNNVRDMAISGRRVGCGITALADMLAAANIKYDSDEGMEVIEKVMKTKMRGELHAGTDLAIIRGTFLGWKGSNEFYWTKDQTLAGMNDFYEMLANEFPAEASLMFRYGRRNVNQSTIAPAGSTSIIAQTEDFPNMSSGCEPHFLPYYVRSQKINPDDENVRVDYVDDKGDSWQEHAVMMGGFKQYIQEQIKFDSSIQSVDHLSKEQVEKFYKNSPYFGATANDIDWQKRVKIQGILQKYTTSAISSTLNLPKDVSKQTVSDIYFAGWKEGVKGITIYRDGCRTGVLNAESNSRRFEYKDAVKRPKILQAETHISTSKGQPYHVIIGLLDGKPYEIFIDDSDNKYSSEGTIVKESRGKYIFYNGETVEIRDFMNPEQQAITRMVSMSLRHGTEIRFIVEQLQKIDDDMFSFTKSLARVLKKYIPDGASSTISCMECGSEHVKFQEGCSTCMECGSSKCG